MERLKGIIPAIVTPINQDETLDVGSFEKLINNIMESGCQGVMILGTAGEGTDLPQKTIEHAMCASVEIMNKRGVVVAGTSNSDFQVVLKNIECAAKAGVDAILNVTPFYHTLGQQVIENFYTRLADESLLPVLIYNMPSHTKNNVDVSTIKKLKNHKNIVGIKDSSGNFIYFQQIASFADEDFKVFMGRAPLIMPAMVAGASGSMTPIGNINPELEVNLHELIQKSNLDQAREKQRLIIEIVKLFSYTQNPITTNLKAIMEHKSICNMQPAGFIPKLEKEQIKEICEKYDALLT